MEQTLVDIDIVQRTLDCGPDSGSYRHSPKDTGLWTRLW